jgi:SET domain-containing protein
MALHVKRSTAGLGLFTDADIKKGDFVIEYTGERITPDEADERGGKYLFTVSDDLVLDGKGREHTARYINHSCRPNCYAEIDEDEELVNIYAKRKIKAGEELNYDYGKEYWDEHIKPYGCRCEKCAGK